MEKHELETNRRALAALIRGASSQASLRVVDVREIVGGEPRAEVTFELLDADGTVARVSAVLPWGEEEPDDDRVDAEHPEGSDTESGPTTAPDAAAQQDLRETVDRLSRRYERMLKRLAE